MLTPINADVAISLHIYFLPKTAPLLAIGCAWYCIHLNVGVVQYQTAHVLQTHAPPVVLPQANIPLLNGRTLRG